MLEDVRRLLAILGGTVIEALMTFVRPSTFRASAVGRQIEVAGVRAVPIVLLMSFLIGGIIAQQGAFQLNYFGAAVFTVDLVGILSLREIAPILTAIMVAGRSGSAITAELGSMQMREEIDALRVMGLDPVNVLVLPRVLALIIVLPLLTFLAALATLLGAMLTLWWYVDITPTAFIDRLLLRDRLLLLLERPDQGALHGFHHRADRLRGGHGGARQRRIARHAHHGGCGEIDLHGHRGRRHLRDLLRGHRLLMAVEGGEPIIKVRGLTVSFGGPTVLENLDVDVRRGEILAIVGASGTGKSVLLRAILGLVRPQAGTIEAFGQTIGPDGPSVEMEKRWGVLFQFGALFSRSRSCRTSPCRCVSS